MKKRIGLEMDIVTMVIITKIAIMMVVTVVDKLTKNIAPIVFVMKTWKIMPLFKQDQLMIYILWKKVTSVPLKKIVTCTCH